MPVGSRQRIAEGREVGGAALGLSPAGIRPVCQIAFTGTLGLTYVPKVSLMWGSVGRLVTILKRIARCYELHKLDDVILA